MVGQSPKKDCIHTVGKPPAGNMDMDAALNVEDIHDAEKTDRQTERQQEKETDGLVGHKQE